MKTKEEAGPHHLKGTFQEDQSITCKVTKPPGVQAGSGLCVLAPVLQWPLNPQDPGFDWDAVSVPRVTPTPLLQSH